MQASSRLLRTILVAIAVAPSVAILCAILAYAVDVPWMDEWIAIGPLFEKKVLGTLDFHDFTAQHKEHRILFPRLICYLLGSWGGWDVRREMIVTFVMAAITAWNVHRLLRTTAGEGTTRVLLLSFLACLFIFSPAQWANWLKGMQMALFLPALCLTSALRLALSPLATWIRVSGGMLLCTVSTFSAGNGCIGWVAWLMLLLSSAFQGSASRKTLLGIWSLGLVSNLALYVHGYRTPLNRPAPLAAFAEPILSMEYFASFLGAPLAHVLEEPSQAFAACLGMTLLALFVACSLRVLHEGGATLQRSLPWLSIGAYSLLSAAMITLARSGMSRGPPLASRYVTFSLYFDVALVALIAICTGNPRGVGSLIRWAGSVCLAALALTVLGTWPGSVARMKEERGIHLQGKACLQLAGIVEDLPGLQILLPGLAGLRNRILAIDRGGFFRPGVLTSRRLQDFSGDPRLDCGVLSTLRRNGDIFVAEGRAFLPWRPEAADAILLAYDRPQGDSVIFTAFILGRTRGLESTEEGVPWRTSFRASSIPAEAVAVSAWAFDALDGEAFRLRGTPLLR